MKTPGIAAHLIRGMVAGVAGTGVMTAFQRYVEMPLTGRQASFAPANFVEKVLPVNATGAMERARLNNIAHYGLGLMWGAAYGVAAHAGLRGKVAVAAMFGVVYTGDVLLNAGLGLYEPSKWSTQDVVVDVVDKYVQATATGMIFDRWLDPTRSS